MERKRNIEQTIIKEEGEKINEIIKNKLTKEEGALLWKSIDRMINADMDWGVAYALWRLWKYNDLKNIDINRELKMYPEMCKKMFDEQEAEYNK